MVTSSKRILHTHQKSSDFFPPACTSGTCCPGNTLEKIKTYIFATYWPKKFCFPPLHTLQKSKLANVFHLFFLHKKNRYLRERIAEAAHLKKEDKESEFKDACIPADNLRVHECLAKRLLFRENAFAVRECPFYFCVLFFAFFFWIIFCRTSVLTEV